MDFFRFELLLNSSATDIVLVTLPSTAVEIAIAQCTSRCAMARGHRLNTSIVLAAVHGLSGLFRAVYTVEPSLFCPPPPPRLPSPSLISHLASVDVKQNVLMCAYIVQELCESRGVRPGLSVLTSLMVSVDVKQQWTMLRHWSQFVPHMSTDIGGHEALRHHHRARDRAHELCESRGGCPGLPSLMSLRLLWT